MSDIEMVHHDSGFSHSFGLQCNQCNWCPSHPHAGCVSQLDVERIVAAARAEERRKALDWFNDLLDAHHLQGQPVYEEFLSDRTALSEAVRNG